MKRLRKKRYTKKTIFKAIFLPLFLIMLIQAILFYVVAIYGGIEKTLKQNSTDILYEKLNTRKNEIENKLNTKAFNLDSCINDIQVVYKDYEEMYGSKPLLNGSKEQIDFLKDCSNNLVDTLRQNETNGIFLIINNQPIKQNEIIDGEQRYGLCIRDMDPDSNYSGRNDLLNERSPSSLQDYLGFPFNSYWDAFYTFDDTNPGDYYFNPINIAWENPTANSDDLAYFSYNHQISEFSSVVVSYSIPLIDSSGYPYGVIGVELTTKYIESFLKSYNTTEESCYVLGYSSDTEEVYKLIAGSGNLYTIYYRNNINTLIDCTNKTNIGGFDTFERNNMKIYGNNVNLNIYNNNNPFQDKQIVLISLVDKDDFFAYIDKIKLSILLVSLICLNIGVLGILFVSRLIASPVITLSKKIKNTNTQEQFQLNHIGISEIDLLVDSIKELDYKVNKTSARTEFFSRMSHDLRTPMNAIISFSSPEMLDNIDETTKDDYLSKIHSSSIYMLGLINEVLDMTKIENNNIELSFVTALLNTICDTAVSMTKELANKKNIELLIFNNLLKEEYVIIDKQRINQIVLNLLSNSIKFTREKGKVILDLQAKDNEQNPEIIDFYIVVSDNGIGMSDVFLEKLYIPFEQENTTKEGTGLGLTITKRLVDLMKGTIQCTSKQGVGTTFKIYFPLLRSSKDKLINNSTPIINKNNYNVIKGKNVLVCEDNEMNAIIVKNLLTKWGLNVEIAMNGEIGLNTFSNSTEYFYDIILMDIRMPVMDGLETTKQIRSLNRSDATSIPIIAMTADAFDEDMRACFKVGMNEHLTKPIEPELFFNTLIRFLDK